MEKLVILNLSEGNFELGFTAILEIGQEGLRPEIVVRGHLPAASHIPQLVGEWQAAFSKKVSPLSNDASGNRSRATARRQSKSSCKDSAKNLVFSINEWLNSGTTEWRKIRDSLQQNLRRSEEIRLIIQTRNNDLRQLPWQVWDLFADNYTKAEIALSEPEYYCAGKPRLKAEKVRILAVLGNSDGIDIQFDRQIFELLDPDETDCQFLEQPTKKRLIEWLSDEQGWHIFFFAGHSSTVDGQIGIFEINHQESINIDELKNTMKLAISHGLQLAIFNSCDGLGLANELAKLQIPQSIVMREPVPDGVAQDFLQYFLTNFALKRSFYGSVLSARKKLEDIWNQEYCGVSWLPIICQNPAVEPPTWQGFLSKTETKFQESFRELKKTWKTEHTLTDHSDIIKSVAIHPDGQIFASCSLDQTIKVWHLTTGELLENLTGHSGGVTCVSFSSDGQTLASSSANPDGTIKLWDTQTWQLKRTLKGDDWVVLSVWSIALTPNGKTLVSGHHADSTVKVWNLETGELRHTLRGHVWAVHDVAIAPDGNIMASGSFDSNIKLWNLQTGREISNLNGPGDGPIGWTRSFFSDNIVYTVSFSPDGQILASGGAKQPIKLWRLSSGELKSNLTGHTDDVYAIAFSPDGKYLASGSADRTIRIWDLFTGEPIHTLGHSDTVYCLAFSPDGQTLVSGSRDRTMKIWRFCT